MCGVRWDSMKLQAMRSPPARRRAGTKTQVGSVMGAHSAREKCAWVWAMCREAGLNAGLRGLDFLETRESHSRRLEQGTLIKALVCRSDRSEGRTWKAETGPLK